MLLCMQVEGGTRLRGDVVPGWRLAGGAGKGAGVDVVVGRGVEPNAVLVKGQHVGVAVAPLVGRQLRRLAASRQPPTPQPLKLPVHRLCNNRGFYQICAEALHL